MWRGTYREFHFSIYTIDEKLYGEKFCKLYFHLCVVTIDFCLTCLYIQKCSVTRFKIRITSKPMMAYYIDYFDAKSTPLKSNFNIYASVMLWIKLHFTWYVYNIFHQTMTCIIRNINVKELPHLKCSTTLSAYFDSVI